MAKTNGSAQASSSAADFTKLMDFSKYMPQAGKMPSFDFQAMMDLQRRQAESLAQVSQQAIQNIQAFAQRQGEMVRESVQETAEMFSHAITPSTPSEKLAKGTEMTKVAIEKALANGKELAEMASKHNMAAMQALGNHITEAMEELRNICANK